MNDNMTKTGVWLIAIVCAFTGLASIIYGYIAIYSLSGFSSIFIGAVIIVIAIGLIKRHSIARIGAMIVLLIFSMGCVMWLSFFQQTLDAKLENASLIEYFCLLYILIALISILFLLLRKTKAYFNPN